MPSIFKALASISAWVLFIAGLILIVWPTLMSIVTGSIVAGPPAWQMVAGWAGGVISLILSVCAMKLRQMLE